MNTPEPETTLTETTTVKSRQQRRHDERRVRKMAESVRKMQSGKTRGSPSGGNRAERRRRSSTRFN